MANNYFADGKDDTIINASFTGKAQVLNLDDAEVLDPSQSNLISGDINNVNKSTIVGGRDVIGGGAKGTEATHTLGDDTIVGDAISLNATTFTGGADKITLQGMNNVGASVVGDALSTSGGTTRGGHDSFIIGGDVTGGTIVGDVETIINTTFIAGNDNIQLKGNVSGAEIYTDAKTLIGVNALSGGNDIVTLGIKPTASTPTSTTIEDTTINLGHGNDSLTAYSIIISGSSLDGGHGNDSFTMSHLNGGILNGDAGNDIFSITHMDTGNVNGGGDNDRISAGTVSGGRMVGGGGNDTISVSGDMIGGVIEGGAATKTISGTKVTYGTDSISVKNISSGTIYGESFGSSGSDTTASYNDIIKVTGTLGQGATIRAGYGDDNVIVNSMEGGSVGTDDGHDTVSIVKATGGSINTSEGDDSIHVTTATATKISGFNGNDSIYVKELKADLLGNKSELMGEAGNDDITVGTSSVSIMDGGSDDDTIRVTNSITSDIKGNTGDDSIRITTATDSQIFGDDGDDTITIITAKNSTVFGGDGSNSISVDTLQHGKILDDSALSDTNTVDVGTMTDASIELGVASDVIKITTVNGANNEIDLGNGNDSLTINNFRATKINDASPNALDMGTGNDSLKILAKSGNYTDTDFANALGSGNDTLDVNWAFNGAFNAGNDGATLIAKGLGASTELYFGSGYDGLIINGAASSNKSGLTDTELANALGSGHDTLSVGWAFNGIYSTDYEGGTLFTKGLGANAVLNFGNGSDKFVSTAALNGTASARKNMDTQSGNDSIELTTINYMDIDTGLGDDSLIISGTASNTNIDLGSGDDSISIGGMGVTTKLRYDVDGLDDITIKGTYNQGMVVDALGNAIALSTGFDGGSVTLDTLGTGKLEFYNHTDSITINKNIAGTSTVKKEISTLGGNDDIDLKGTVTNTIVDAGTGVDTISIGALSTGSVLKYNTDGEDSIVIKGTYNDGFVQATTTDGTFYGLATDAQEGTTGGSITLDTLGTGKLQFGDGADTLTINKALSGSLGFKDIFMQGGADSLIVNSVNGAVMSGGAGNDAIFATGLGATGELRGDAGNDDIQIGMHYTDPSARKVTATMNNGIIDGGSNDDTITIGNTYSDGSVLGTMSGGKIYGGYGEDTITVTSLNGSALMDGGVDNDQFTITNMSGGIIHGGEDEDVIDILGTFSRGTINGGNGADTINITTMSGGLINGEVGFYGVDSIAIHTMLGGSINATTGDSITITHMNGGSINDSAGDSFAIAVTTMSNGTINGNAGVDSIKITENMSGGVINGGDGNDTVIIKNMSGGTIYAQNDNDSINIESLSGGTVNVGEGNNTITIEDALNGGSIIAGTGDDTLVLNDGIELGTKYNIDLGAGENEVQVNADLDGQALTLGSANDNVYLNKDVQNTKINLGSGNDSIEGVVTSTNAVIDLGSGNDSISLSNFGAGSIIYGGAGNDTINAAAANDAVIDLGSGNNNLDVATITNTVIVGNTGHDNINITGDLDAASEIFANTGNDSIEIGGSLDGSITYDNRGLDTIKLASYAGTGIENTYAIASHAALSTGTDGGKIELKAWTGGDITFGNGHDTFVLSGELLDHNDTEGAHELAFMLGNDSIDIGGALTGSITYDNRGLDTIKLASYAGVGIENIYDSTKHVALSTGTDGGKIELKAWTGGDITFGNGHDTFVLSGELLNHNTEDGAHELEFMSGNDHIEIGGALSGSITYDNRGLDTIKLTDYAGTGIENTYDPTKHADLSTGTDGGTIELGTWSNGDISFGNGHDKFVLSGELKNHNATEGAHELNFMNGNDTIQIGALAGSFTYDNEGFDSITIDGEYNGTGVSGTYKGADQGLSTGTDGGFIHVGSITKEGIDNLSFGNGNDHFSIGSMDVAGKTIDLGLGNDTITASSLTNGTLSGGDGTNTYNIADIGIGGTILGGTGVDTITVTNAMSGTINADTGNNKIIANTVSGDIITGTGADNISITGNLSGAINAGLGNDSITTDASFGTIYGDDTLNNTSNFTAGSDKITVARLSATATIIGDANAISYDDENTNKFTVRGGNDSITVEGNITGTNSNNAVTIVGDMQNVTDAKTFTAGNDTITLKGNVSYAEIYTDAESVSANTSVNGGNDTLTLGIKGQEGQTVVTNSTINLGVGNDTITVYSTIGDGAEIHGEDGLDGFIVSHMQDGEINGGAHNDTFKITTMSGGTVYGGAHNDAFTITTMDGGTVYGGADNDVFTITTMDGGTVDGGAGADRFNISTMTDGSIDAGADNDSLTFTSAVTGGTIYGGTSTRTESGTRITLGSDTITLRDVTQAHIYGDKQSGVAVDDTMYSYKDFIKINGISNGSIIDAGHGDDSIYIAQMQGSAAFGNTGDDTITIGTARNGSASGGDGDDKITVTTGIGDGIDGGFSIDGGFGDDAISITTINRGSIDGHLNNDDITIGNAYNSEILGGTGTGDDSIKVTGTLDSSSIDGGDGDDSISIGTAKYSSIHGGAGNDSISVTTAIESSFDSGEGNDTIFISNQIKSAVSLTTSGSGQDEIYLKSGVGLGATVTLSGSGGFNVGASATAGFNMSGGTLTASVGDDTLRINTLSSGHVDAGAGADSITIVTMNGGHVNSGEDYDTINITNAITKTVSIENSGTIVDNLYLTKGIASGANITLEGDAGFNVLGALSSAGFTMSGGTLTGSDNADRFTLANMTAGTIHGGAGNDTFNLVLNGASKGILDGGDGVDIFTITATKNSSINMHNFTGDDSIIIGDDTVTVADFYGQDSYVVTEADGDKITLNFNNVYMNTSSYGSLAQDISDKVIHGTAGADTITLRTVSNSEIHGDAGADSISIATINNSSIYTGSDNIVDTIHITNAINKTVNINNQGFAEDNLYLKTGIATGANVNLTGFNAGFIINNAANGTGFNFANGTLNASEYGDTIIINTMSGGTLKSNSGTDTLNITSMTNGSIDAGSENDSISISTMRNGTLNGGVGVDSISISTMHNGTVHGGADADTITIATMNGGTINGGAGTDEITIDNAVTKTIRINNEEGFDTINLGGGVNNGAHIILGGEGGFVLRESSSGNDFQMNGGTISGSVGSEQIYIDQMLNGTINGGAGADIIDISTMKAGTLDGGAGRDNIAIADVIESKIIIKNSGTEQDSIYFGNDTAVDITEGANITLSSTAGFNVSSFDMDGGTLTTSAGADTLTINSLSGGKIFSGSGNDSISVDDVDNFTAGSIDAGAGNDTLILHDMASGGNLPTGVTVNGGAGVDVLGIGAVITSDWDIADKESELFRNFENFQFEALSVGGKITGYADKTNNITVIGGMSAGELIGGNKNDLLELDEQVSGGTIETLGGVDTINLNQSINTPSTVTIKNSGAARDILNLTSIIDGGVVLNSVMGSGADTVVGGGFTVDMSAIGVDASLRGSEAADSINIQTLSGTVYGGAGLDTITVHNTISQDISMSNTGAERDILNLKGGIGEGTQLTLNSDAGFDVNLGNMQDDSTLIGSNGSDKIIIEDVIKDAVTYNGVDGHDSVFLHQALEGTLSLYDYDNAHTPTLSIAQSHNGKSFTGFDIRGGTLMGSNGVDNIYVNTIHKISDATAPQGSINGLRGDDIINVVTMNGGSVEGGLGDDTITIGTMNGGSINAGDGFNDIYISTMNGGTVNDGTGSDNIIIGTMNGGTVYSGDDNTVDFITIKNTLTKTVSFENSGTFSSLFLEKGIGAGAVVNLSSNSAIGFNVNNRLAIGAAGFTMSGGELNGSTAADAFTINTMSAGTINANAGNDSFSISTMNNGAIHGDAGEDTFTITTMNGGRIDGGVGNDVITVATLNGGTIDGGAGADTIIVTEFTKISINNSGTEQDTFYVGSRNFTDGMDLTLKGDGGFYVAWNDPNGFTMSGGKITGSKGADYFKMIDFTGGTLDGGAGVDTIEISSYGKTPLSIKNSGAEKDVLYFKSSLHAEANITLDSSAGFVVTDDDGTGISISGASLTGSSGADSLLVGSMSGALDGAGGDDTITVGEIRSSSTLNGGGGDDIITVTEISTSFLNGDAGNDAITVDVLTSGTIDGGAGNDTIIVDAMKSGTIDGGVGNDSLNILVGNDTRFSTLDGGVGADTFHIGNVAGESGEISIKNFEIGTDTLIIGNDTIAYSGQSSVTVGDVTVNFVNEHATNTIDGITIYFT